MNNFIRLSTPIIFFNLLNSFQLSESMSESADESTFNTHTIIVILLFIGILILFIIVAALLVYLIKGKYRHSEQVRRQKARQRQTIIDSEQARMNGENLALNNA